MSYGVLKSRRVTAGGAAVLLACWLLVIPLAGLGQADLVDTSLSGGTDTLEGTTDPIPVASIDPLPIPELPEDPIGTVEDLVNGVLNPPPPPDEGGSPPTPDNDPGSTNDPKPPQNPEGEGKGPGNQSTTTNSSSDQETRAPGSEQSPSSSTQDATGLQPNKGTSPYRSYRPAATRFASFPAGGIGDYRRSPGGRSTSQILRILQEKKASPGVIARILAPFPVAGRATYSDDWGAPRYAPTFHLHEGVDIFAERGTPVIGATEGVVNKLLRQSSSGGTSVWLTAADGTYFFYGHLDRFAPRLIEGMSVSEGEVIGFVGASGNAEGGAPHLHFEIHPKGGAAVPPIPYLDRWLAEALHAARAFKAAPTRLSQLVNAPVRAVASVSRALGSSLAATQTVSLSDLGLWLAILAVPVGLWLKRKRRRAPSLLPEDGVFQFLRS